MRDGGDAHIDRERVNDVTTHPALRNSVRSIACLYDALHDPRQHEMLTCPTDTDSGGYTHRFFRVPRSREHVRGAQAAIAARARLTCGLPAKALRCTGGDEARGNQVLLGEAIAWRNLFWSLSNPMANDPDPVGGRRGAAEPGRRSGISRLPRLSRPSRCRSLKPTRSRRSDDGRGCKAGSGRSQVRSARTPTLPGTPGK